MYIINTELMNKYNFSLVLKDLYKLYIVNILVLYYDITLYFAYIFMNYMKIILVIK